MTGYRFAIGCPLCGGELAHVTGSAVAGSQAVAVTRCEPCRREWSVSVHLRPLPGAEARRKRAQRERVAA